MIPNDKTRITITLNKETLKKLKEICKYNQRTISNEISWKIENDYKEIYTKLRGFKND